jgi:hypothetical protein
LSRECLTPKPDQTVTNGGCEAKRNSFFFAREPIGLRGGGNGWYALGGWGLVGSEDRSYKTPLVRSLRGHHYWTIHYGDGPLEGQNVPTRHVELRHYFSRMY